MILYTNQFCTPQVLLTGNDLRQHSTQKWLLHTMNSLLQMKVVPVLNGNDALAPDPTDSSHLENSRKASGLTDTVAILLLVWLVQSEQRL